VKITKKEISLPHIFAIMFGLIAMATILTWVLPAGNYDRFQDPKINREIIVSGSYHLINKGGVGIWEVGKSIFEGFVASSDLIIFLLIASGYINILTLTGSISELIHYLLDTIKNTYIIIPVFFLIFAIAGSTIGIYEEVFILIPIFMITFEKIGFGKLTGAAVIIIGSKVGMIASTLNPFTVGIASTIAGTELGSLNVVIFRLISFVLLSMVSICYLLFYAIKIRPCVGIERREEEFRTSHSEKHNFCFPQIISLLWLLIVFVAIAIGVIRFDFAMPEIATLFLFSMILTGCFNRININTLSESFIDSSKSMVKTMIIISLSKTIQIIMEKGNIIDTVVYFLSNSITQMSKELAAITMLIIQVLLSFFIPSASGHAMVSMPIMAALSDSIGISRDVAVLCYQYGNGLGTLFWPTGCALVCSVMGIKLEEWYKYIYKLVIVLALLELFLVFISLFFL